jgi:hypothetical protein
MKRAAIMALAASAALSLSTVELNAQGRGNGQAQATQQQQREAERERLRAQREREAERERLRADRDRRASVDPRDERWDQQRRGNGPAFCRSGQGHPVHGRQWCQQKGFGLGNERWDRARWDDVIFGQPRDRRRYEDGRTMNRGTLADILGDVVLRRFENHGSQHARGPITGQWLTGVDGRIMQLSIGGVPFAQLVDSRGRGRADQILLRR